MEKYMAIPSRHPRRIDGKEGFSKSVKFYVPALWVHMRMLMMAFLVLRSSFYCTIGQNRIRYNHRRFGRWRASIVLTLGLVVGICAYAQVPDDSLTRFDLILEIPGAVNLFQTDRLGNIFVADTKNEIRKYDARGNLQFRYSNNNLGELATLDATDPFNLLLFYPNYETVITLDRTLTPTGEYNLFDLGVPEVRALGMSRDNKIWVYDLTDFRLKKIDQNGKLLLASDDLSLTLGRGLQPNFIIERDQQVFVNDPEVGILVFDLFGRYLKTIDLKGLSDFQIVQDRIIYWQGEQLRSFHLSALLDRPIRTPFLTASAQPISIRKNVWYVALPDRIQVFVRQ